MGRTRQMAYRTVRHPKSGETYAAEVNEEGEVVRLAGPLHHSDATDEQAIEQAIANSAEAETDAEWWRGEVETTIPLTDTLTYDDCLDGHDLRCDGEVRWRHALSATGRSFPRCDFHWDARLVAQERIDRDYPDSPLAPAWFDPTYAGEQWDADY